MWNRLRRWLNDLPIHDPIERRQALLVQVILLGLSGVLLFSALLTLVALPFTSGAMAAANLHNSINNFRSTLFVVAPFVLLRRGYFRVAVAILMIELFLLAFNTVYALGLEAGWIGALAFALPISLAALALGRRWLLVMYAASIAGVAATAFARYPLTGLPQNAPSATIAFGLIAGLLALFLDRFGAAFRESLAALAHNYSLLSAVIEGTPDAVYVKDLHGRYLMMNAAGAHILGLAAEQAIGKDDTALFGAGAAPLVSEDERRIMERGNMPPYEQSATVNGVTRIYLASKAPYRDQHGNVIGVISISRDITEHKNLEAQLLQSQKMESIGQLAGGIAHDFNNMLSAVIGFIGSAREELPQNSSAQHDLEVAESAAWRAAGLTRQLLAFARKQIVDPRVLNLNMVILDMDKLLRRLIGADIDLITLTAPDLGQVKVDPGHIEQVILNLAINARDAMPNGGKLIIETANTMLDIDYTDQHVGVIPGAYVMLAISDTGIGMDTGVQQHIFEPFYTTKEIGKGTGLGLSTCYGIIKQHGGHIWVYSEVGHGTTFKIYLLPVEEALDLRLRFDEVKAVPQGSETVLLVEDEPLVRELASTILHAQGYTVLAASNGEEALHVVQMSAGSAIDILVTDVVMPGMRGKALVEQVTNMYPNIKVLFISGYATDAITQHGRLEPGMHFLSKPFTRMGLACKVREVLDS
jgi:two-component system cell cycle sensor histidine kinase/response regulator CckA